LDRLEGVAITSSDASVIRTSESVLLFSGLAKLRGSTTKGLSSDIDDVCVLFSYYVHFFLLCLFFLD